MGLWQNLVNSYDKNSEALNKKYPLSTTSISNNGDIIAVVIIDGTGSFIRSDKIEKKSEETKKGPGNPLVNITIPVSEKSMGRSSGISPHPIFDQYEYIKGIVNKSDKYIKRLYEHCDHVRECIKISKSNSKRSETFIKKWKEYSRRIKKLEVCGKKYDAYIEQLKDFAESGFATEQVKAIYKYVAKRTIAFDLSGMKLKDETNIIFQVDIPGNNQPKVWEDETFFNAWHQYYLDEKKKIPGKKKQAQEKLDSNNKISEDEKKKLKEQLELKDEISLDYITGIIQPTATFHPKKISNASANAKLVSDNDKTNYTFRGKFSESTEAVSIGYESSQKAHQFLRYLINDRGNPCGEQVIFSFTIGSVEKLLPLPIKDESIWAFLKESQPKSESDKQIALRAETGFDYAEALRKSLAGFGYSKALEQHEKTAILALDAPSDGRMSITFYREIDRNEYLEKIAEWHEKCKWNQKYWNDENKEFIPYIGAPSVDKIIVAVYGKPRSGEDKSYIKIKKAARERLLRCIFDGAHLPRDFVEAAIRQSSNPLGITKDNKFDRNGFEQIISTTCALIRKYFQQTDKEDYKLSIELERNDRDYLYGRLLGAADELEEYALSKKENDRIVTAAIRYMQAFSQRPFRTWKTIHDCLNPYIQIVKGSFAFNEIQNVKNQFGSGDFEKDAPLNGSYLIGYYHERAYIDSLVKDARNKKQSVDNKEKENCNDGE